MGRVYLSLRRRDREKGKEGERENSSSESTFSGGAGPARLEPFMSSRRRAEQARPPNDDGMPWRRSHNHSNIPESPGRRFRAAPALSIKLRREALVDAVDPVTAFVDK